MICRCSKEQFWFVIFGFWKHSCRIWRPNESTSFQARPPPQVRWKRNSLPHHFSFSATVKAHCVLNLTVLRCVWFFFVRLLLPRQAPKGCSETLPPVGSVPIRHCQPGFGLLPWQQVQPCTLSNGGVRASKQVGVWEGGALARASICPQEHPFHCLLVCFLCCHLRPEPKWAAHLKTILTTGGPVPFKIICWCNDVYDSCDLIYCINCFMNFYPSFFINLSPPLETSVSMTVFLKIRAILRNFWRRIIVTCRVAGE